jgi:multidrug efflux system membrane fusion protein
MRPVTVGATEGNTVQVTSGIAPGEMIVIDGQDKLQEGSRVEVRPETGAGAGAGSHKGQGNAPATPAKRAPAAGGRDTSR